MRLLLVALLAGPALAGLGDRLSAGVTSLLGAKCDRDVTREFRQALYDFSTKLYKQVAKQQHDHFVVSQYSVWLALAALAEGAAGPARDELLAALNLPEEDCLRHKYYDIATKLESPGDDVTLARKRYLVLDEGAPLNATWARWARDAGLLGTLSLSLRGDPPRAAAALRDLLAAAPPRPAPPPGAALLVDTLDYSGLWTTAFPDADVTTNVPFYDDRNEQIGTVDMMKVTRKVKLAHLPVLNAKVVEIPVGRGGRYKLLVLVNLGRVHIRDTIELFRNTIIVDVFDNLLESAVPLQVSLPRFSLRTGPGDLRAALEALGVRALWRDPAAGAPALLLQRAAVNVTAGGLAPPSAGSRSLLGGLTAAATGLAAAVGREFTADRPFMFGLVDASTKTCLFTGAFTIPDKH